MGFGNGILKLFLDFLQVKIRNSSDVGEILYNEFEVGKWHGKRREGERRKQRRCRKRVIIFL